MPIHKENSPITMYDILKEVSLMEMNKGKKRPAIDVNTDEQPPLTRNCSTDRLSGLASKDISHEVEVTPLNAIKVSFNLNEKSMFLSLCMLLFFSFYTLIFLFHCFDVPLPTFVL